MKIYANMICGDENPKILEKAIKSIRPFVDEMLIGFNGKDKKLINIFQKYKCQYFITEWHDNFGASRQEVLDKTPKDAAMIWLDSDDEVINGKAIRDLVDTGFGNPRIGAIWCNWAYDHDENGNCLMTLRRERIVRASKFEWRSRLHECLYQVQDCVHMETDAISIKHNAEHSKIAGAAIRNAKIINDEYEKEKKAGQIDPKTLYDLARSLGALGINDQALPLYQEYVRVTQYDAECCMAYMCMGDIHKRYRQYMEAVGCFTKVIEIKPNWPDGYLGLAFTYFAMEKWEEALSLIKVASQFKPAYGLIPIDPSKYTLKPLRYAAFAQFNLGNWEEAFAAATEVLKFEPKNEAMIMIRDKAQITFQQIQMTDNLIEVKKELDIEGNKDKLKALASAIPAFMQDQPVFIRLRNQFNENKANRMVMFCGLTTEMWSPLSVKKGIGGSEEAVINMSKELAKLGWIIDVYCACDAPGNYDGVEYHNYWEYDNTQHCDIFVMWRNQKYIDYAPKKSRVFVWIHDVQHYDYWNDEWLARTEKIFPLSKYHRSLLSKFPDDKFYITRNGIVPGHFQVEKKKTPYSCVYASSPDRGLEVLLDIWPEIYKAYPKATLNVLYGFTKGADEINKVNPGWLPWKYKILDSLKDLEKMGVIYRGKVSHLELADIFNNSEYWLYPCFQFDEISCITAMKAQAASCYPITTDRAALDETVQYGIKVKNNEGQMQDNRDRYLKAVLDKFKQGVTPAEQKEMSDWAIKTFGWQEVAKEWNNLFRGDKGQAECDKHPVTSSQQETVDRVKLPC